MIAFTNKEIALIRSLLLLHCFSEGGGKIYKYPRVWRYLNRDTGDPSYYFDGIEDIALEIRKKTDYTGMNKYTDITAFFQTGDLKIDKENKPISAKKRRDTARRRKKRLRSMRNDS